MPIRKASSLPRKSRVKQNKPAVVVKPPDPIELVGALKVINDAIEFYGKDTIVHVIGDHNGSVKKIEMLISVGRI